MLFLRPWRKTHCLDGVFTEGMHVAARLRMASAERMDGISRKIVEAAIRVHKAIGPGCFESAYHPCFAIELQKRRLDFQREAALSLSYEGVVVPRAYVADFIVEASIVVEIKAIAAIGRIEQRQLQTYLRMSGCSLGLLLNFGAPTMVEGIKRIVNNFPDGTKPLAPEMTE
ncbi:MAG: GxxExxY protein [Vicinamibacterales bacterium]